MVPRLEVSTRRETIQPSGIIVDSFHTLALGDDPAGIANLPGDRIFFVQIADSPLLTMDVPEPQPSFPQLSWTG